MPIRSDIHNLENDLMQHAKIMKETHLSSLMAAPDRDKLIFHHQDLCVDMTRQPLSSEILSALISFAEHKNLGPKIEAMFSGKPINLTENRAVCHMNLRHPDRLKSEEWQKLARFADATKQQGQFQHIINIGIGGSDLGPAMVAQALGADITAIDLHFVGNIDPAHLYDTLQMCQPDKTLIIVTSKTFTTAETLANAALARQWLEDHDCNPANAIVAVTAAPEQALSWGIERSSIFEFDTTVGGRFSLWSAVGLATIIGLGCDKFEQFLAGAHEMDVHFQNTDFNSNLPVLMGLLRVWHRNYLCHSSYALIPYQQRLSRLAAWAQQLEMESNGKSVTTDGQPPRFSTAPLIWGEPGTNAQHSFFQWLHQGSEIHPLDILVTCEPVGVPEQKIWRDSHRQLVINAIAQAEALARGNTDVNAPHKHFEGNRPSVLISWDQLTPYSLGRLLALYEHVTAVCGFLWDINSFDQFGVELGKQMARDLDEGRGREKFSRSALELLDRLSER